LVVRKRTTSLGLSDSRSRTAFGITTRNPLATFATFFSIIKVLSATAPGAGI